MSVDQFSAVVELLPQLETALREKGHTIPRPAYSSHKPAASDNGEDDEADEDVEEEQPDIASEVQREKFTHKANHEATSDEDDG